jgi:hypothetical protein
MKSAIKALLLLCIIYSAGPGSAIVNAETLEEFKRDGHIKVAVSVLPENDVVPGQKTQLIIEIATDTWFTGGTRITPPEVPGLVILQNEQFASNATEVQGATTWVIQRWALDIFPQREGEHTIQPVRLKIKTRGHDGNDLEGELYTPPTQLQVTLPEALAGLKNWVAASDFSVSREFDKSTGELVVGDAIAHSVTFEATGVMAMMLPQVSYSKPSGMSVYPDPPVLESSNNRGSLTAMRSRTITYVAEKSGSYSIPPEEFYWWDTTSGELKTASLPEVPLIVGGGTFTEGTGIPYSISTILYSAGVLAILLTLLAWIYKRTPRLPETAVIAVFKRLRARITELRKPALPARLNPGSNAGD